MGRAGKTLTAFMATVKTECRVGRPRNSVDDITLRVEGDMAIECVARTHARLEKLDGALRRDNMALNDGKQQVLGLTKEVKEAWKQYGEVTQIAKNLGVHHHGYKGKRPELDAARSGGPVGRASCASAPPHGLSEHAIARRLSAPELRLQGGLW